MSGVRKLGIRGIRSFGPDDNDGQYITFEKPLTLILGENGCGKTTIIECLKYALCGELPPNSNNGQSFVHDPKVNKSREVLGQIRLQFADSKNSKYWVVRSMQAQIKQVAGAKKMQFKTLDTSITMQDHSGNPVEISGRCGDTDETVASILGVSKAILNSVIFCHQEDSNWPLDEGKKLKERFDAIFDATKYNKCFESIRKMRKQFSIDIKLLAQEVDFLSEKKSEFNSKKKKISADENKIANAKTKLTELEEKLLPIQKRLKVINAVETNLVQYRSEREMTKAKMENSTQQQKELRKIIKILYAGSDEELRNEIVSFESNLRSKARLLEDSGKNLNSIQRMETDVAKQISMNEMKKSELFTLEGQHQDKISQRNEQLIKAAEFGGLTTPDNIETDADASMLLSLISKKLRSLSNELKELKTKADNEEKQLQISVDGCRDASARHKQKIASTRQECDQLKKQKNKLTAEISEATESKAKLETIKEKMEVSDRNFQNISEECDVTTCQETINNDETTVNTFEKELEELSDIIHSMQRQQSKLAEINIRKESLATKQKNAMRLKNKHKDSMSDLIGKDIPEKNFKSTFHTCQVNVKKEVETLNKSLKTKQNKIIFLETNLNHQKKQIETKKKELTTAEEQLYKYCRKQSLESVLQKLVGEINKLQDQKSELSSSEYVIKRFVDKLEDDKPCCPLCHRGFDSQGEVSELVTELKDKIQNVPKDLESVIDSLSRKEEERDQLVGMRPLDERVNSLKTNEIPELEKKLDETEKELQDARDDVESLSMSVSEPERKLTTLSSLLPDMPLLDQLIQEITNVSSEISKLESQIQTRDDGLTLDAAVAKQGETRQETNKLRAAIKMNQTKLNRHNAKLQAAREEKNKLQEQLLKAQAKIQELCSLQTQYDTVVEAIDGGEAKLVSLAESSNNLKFELDKAEENKKNTVAKLREEIEQHRKKHMEFDKLNNSVCTLNRDIDDHKSKNVTGQLDTLKITLAQLHTKKDDLAAKVVTQLANIDKIKDEISNQQINKRELDDNLKLRTCESEQKELQVAIARIDDSIGELNHAILSKEKKSLIETENSSILDMARTEGEIKQLQETVRQGNIELKQPMYKNVEDKHRRKFYELELLKVADNDIKEYAVAMDVCLMEFHKKKMEKINFIVRDMWRNIYRGNDIDYIEIKTDEDTAATNTGNKKVYKYRVVQRRNDVEIDMRGRCSAGQKVLACLIIRMALAETFSNRFGVLAMDEPTTNLDKENITSLCSALGDMVLSRMKQNNFMFIIITHDEEFLTSLGRIDKLTHYYEVARNQDGRSRISKKQML